jgi:hypothetical protein
MNNKQRIVLIIGTVFFLYVLFTSPKFSIIKGTYVIPPPDKKEIAKIVDVSTAMTRAVAILGATLLVSIALKDKKGTQAPCSKDRKPLLDEHDQESEKQPVQKNVIAKIFGFLENFF